MRSRPGSRRILQLAASATLAATMIAPSAGAQPATTSSPAPTTTSVPSSPSPATSSSSVAPTAGPTSQGTPPEQRRDQATPSPDFTTFACEAFWNPTLGRNFTLCGRILDKYIDFGRVGGPLGPPTSDEILNPDGVGKRASFQNNSSIYWHPDTDAHQIGGLIGDKWAEFGYESGALGYPITDELTNPDGGKRQAFLNDSSIYYTAATGAHQIGGDIGKRWGDLGWEASYLGYPTTDELTTPNGAAQLNHFEGGSIYWSQPTQARDLTSEMMSVWAAFGWETGELGLPTSNTTRGNPDISPLQASASPRPQETVFQGGIGVVGYGDEGYIQLPETAYGQPARGGENNTLQVPGAPDPDQGAEANAQDDAVDPPEFETMAADGPSAIEDFFPTLRCDTWSPLPVNYSYLRKGQYFYGTDSGFGRVKAQLKHNIGYGDGNDLDSFAKVSEVRRVWTKTLAVAMLGGGCNTAESDTHSGVFETRFLGMTCAWGGRACLPDPRENITVRSVEDMEDSDDIPDGDRKIGNLSLHCRQENEEWDCPNWIARAAPFTSIN